ncbi:hypothetical protein K470DRAFT_212781 [Piedraia hortae CBS 480.64]|uniref:Pyridoxamine 5'-phosphate oxidase Alr4036 family FMN-binding domain-containing protein n=1 Tax=Piedraia hortae CBS 480.64 TaxID=1314780 RepID=A0A6A7C4R3_9PEZI|nr:hypothetical protein K470DRAFT_212781 [Piedraia hortae CBS 480.64]
MPSSNQLAPWKAPFSDDLTQFSSPEFVFSTVHCSSNPQEAYPRARYCIHRGFFASLPYDKHNSAPKNEAVYESDLPTFTTDVRMEKVGELERQSGGLCECVYWVKERMHQWRVRGRAFVLAEKGIEKDIKDALLARMREIRPSGVEDWSWEKEIVAHFGNLSPGMRGSFKAPPPGQRKDLPYDKELELGKEASINDPVARRHFRVVVIVPYFVERTDLSDPATAKRTAWEFSQGSSKGENQRWKEWETWP